VGGTPQTVGELVGGLLHPAARARTERLAQSRPRSSSRAHLGDAPSTRSVERDAACGVELRAAWARPSMPRRRGLPVHVASDGCAISRWRSSTSCAVANWASARSERVPAGCSRPPTRLTKPSGASAHTGGARRGVAPADRGRAQARRDVHRATVLNYESLVLEGDAEEFSSPPVISTGRMRSSSVRSARCSPMPSPRCPSACVALWSATSSRSARCNRSPTSWA